MDVTNLGATGPTGSRSRRSGTVDVAAQAFQKADKRIQQQRDSVAVQLSSLGKLKSSVSEAQTASRALSDVRKTDTDASVTKAANNFVKSFNNATQTAAAVVTPHATLADSARARAAGSDLRRSLANDAAIRSDLRKIGFSQQKDGSLAIDARKFEAALKSDAESLRSTLSRAGEQVDRVATKELAGNGNVGRAVNALDERARKLENQQTEQQAQAAAVQQAVSTQTANLSNSLLSGAAAYQRIFSL